MEVNRRDFLKISAAGVGGVVLGGLAAPKEKVSASQEDNLLDKQGEEVYTVCSFCSTGCGIVATVKDGKIVNFEGDADNPINQGALCPKGVAMKQAAESEERLTGVLYRAPYSDQWEEKSWDWAIEQVARRIKDTRDNNWLERDGDGNLVNRTEAIATLATAFPNSEEAYLMSKMIRALGIVYVENPARICISSAVTANIETVGRGPTSNHWIDHKNSDCVMIIGGNAAESFPNAFRWIKKAQENGGKIIHVDPRYTRTSKLADYYAMVRAGTDIAFIGGMIRYVLDDMESNPQEYNMTYVREYTNATYLVNPDFKCPTDTLDGLFSGWKGASYDKSTWSFQADEEQADGIAKDSTLTDPNCVFQLLKKHFSRYTDDKVVEITGVDKDTFQDICRAFAATGRPDKAGAIFFSAAACQHTTGTQTNRAFGILQLLLGNMGVAGGGLNGNAGAGNGLGCTLQGMVNHWGPGGGSTRMPNSSEQTIEEYGGTQSRFVSILKAWYGDIDHNTSYNYLPKRTGGSYTWQDLFKAIDDGVIKGVHSWGNNSAVSGINTNAVKQSLSRLDWLIVTDLWETETASFWKAEAGSSPEDIKTEVFALPAAHALEKEGSTCSGARWLQWRYKVVDPPGEAKTDAWIINHIMLELKKLYTGQGDCNADAINNLTWNYGDEPVPDEVSREMNGYDLTTGTLLSSPGQLKTDGTTSCGNWLWCGMNTEEGNQAKRRDNTDESGIGLYPAWGWAWPLNRRIMYNRASVDLDGNPWNAAKPVLKWNAASEKWLGDVADGGAAPVNLGGSCPFIMNPESRGRIFGPGRADGPFPEHYEPWESPVDNPLSDQQSNPALMVYETTPPGSKVEYPLVGSCHRMVEHMHTGSVTRRLTWLLELVPNMVVQIGPELAESRGIDEGDEIVVKSARGEVKATATISSLVKPVKVGSTTVHQISVPWSWGYEGVATGNTMNMLSARVMDPNTRIPESRPFLCNIYKV